MPTLGTIDRDFDHNWRTVVLKSLAIKDKPEVSTERRADGWYAKSGTASFDFNGMANAAILVTLGDLKIQTCVVILTNTTDFETELEAFLASIMVQSKSTKPVTPAPISTSGNGNGDQRLIGRWQRAGSASMDIGNPGYWGSSGYDVSRYEFFSDGTYSFKSRSFRNLYNNIIIVKENGTYNANATQLTIQPTQSVIQSYAKQNGVDELGEMLRTQNRQLEKITYTYTFHYFSGLQEWNLVLQASQPTQRDGVFSSNKTFPNAWYFNQKYIQNDPTSTRYHR